jgi:hypothetical protein
LPGIPAAFKALNSANVLNARFHYGIRACIALSPLQQILVAFVGEFRTRKPLPKLDHPLLKPTKERAEANPAVIVPGEGYRSA